MHATVKSLFGYILLALGGLFVTYLYNVVDGIFCRSRRRLCRSGRCQPWRAIYYHGCCCCGHVPYGRRRSAEMREMSAQYVFYDPAFSVPMLMSACLAVFVRNDGSPLSFVGMCIGAAASVFFDWLFIFPLDMGIIGAALAIAVSRGIILKAIAIFCIPMLFGSNSIWIAPFAAELVTLILAAGLSRASKLVYQ